MRRQQEIGQPAETVRRPTFEPRTSCRYMATSGVPPS
jgi:hypothetical protein